MARPTRTEILNADLHQLYVVEKRSMQAIARMLGCTPENVLYHMRKRGIPTRSKSAAQLLSPKRTWSPELRAKHMKTRATPEYREKLAAAKRGEKSHLWRGGITDPEACRLAGHEWRLRRQECYARDNWTCQDCGVKCRNKVRIQAHHVVPRRHGGGDELGNLVTLCASCHQGRERRYADALFA